jgi:hypothetical protein
VIPSTVGLVPGLSEMLTEVLTTDSLLAGPVSGFSTSIPIGFGPECSSCGDGAIPLSAVVQITPVVQVPASSSSVLDWLSDVRSPTLASSSVLAWHSDGGIPKPTKSLLKAWLS